MTMTTTIAPILLVSLLAAHAHNNDPNSRYRVLDEKDWFRGHLDDTKCHSLDDITSLASSRASSPTTIMLPLCPVPNPYSSHDPLYVKLGGLCNDKGEVCCIVEEEDWCPDSSGEVVCSACGDCTYPQIVRASCCDANIINPCDEHQICCKCGPGHDSTSYQCLEEGEQCRECPMESAPTISPDGQWMTTPTPSYINREEL